MFTFFHDKAYSTAKLWFRERILLEVSWFIGGWACVELAETLSVTVYSSRRVVVECCLDD